MMTIYPQLMLAMTRSGVAVVHRTSAWRKAPVMPLWRRGGWGKESP
jgi:hypothetical protein